VARRKSRRQTARPTDSPGGDYRHAEKRKNNPPAGLAAQQLDRELNWLESQTRPGIADLEARHREADGMFETCVINLDHVQTVQRAKLGALITTPKPEKLEQVRVALLFALGFPPSVHQGGGPGVPA
jgi:hypothetical protein